MSSSRPWVPALSIIVLAACEQSASAGCRASRTDADAVVDGDFAVSEEELQPGVNIVAIHHHMSGETPRILFLHYWGRGKSGDLAASVKKALDSPLTRSDFTSTTGNMTKVSGVMRLR